MPLFTIYEFTEWTVRPIGEADTLQEARERCYAAILSRPDADTIRALDDHRNAHVTFERGPGGEIVDFSPPAAAA